MESKTLNERGLAHLRHPDGQCFGLTQRVRVILTPKDRVKEREFTTYVDRAKPAWCNRVLIRSSSNVYN
jgi:iron(III) transport system substrate-binding protein